MTVHHGRDQWQRVRIAADSDGRLRGLSVDLLADMGAYLMLLTPGVPLLGGFMSPAIYKMDAYSFRCTGVFTTKMPTDAYRGAGRPEATFLIHRTMDDLAAGQGNETAWSQIVADQLGVPFEDIRVLHGDTQVAPKGMDTYGSRSLTVGGMAIAGACDKVIAKAKVIASALLEAPPETVEFAAGKFSAGGGKEVSIQEVALATFAAHNLPDGVEPSLDSDATYDPANFSFPHGTHLCATEVDTETGMVTIRSYVAVDDVGKVVNPLIVEGQVHGGIAQGIAQALYEEAVYDDAGNLLTTTLADYLVPSAADLPSYVTDRTESPASNRLGVKGVGEAGTIASTPAVVNAIVDALRPLGVSDIPMPCTPERVWRAIQAAQAGAPAGGAQEGGDPA